MQQIVKTLAKTGQLPVKPLFMPLFFAAAAKVAGLTPQQFYTNPTKISNGLRQLQGPLRCDVLACYVDQTLIAEAMGATLRWAEGLPQVMTPPAHLGSGDVIGQGRIPVMLDVVGRLRTMLRERVALAVALPGPFTTAGYLSKSGSEPEPADYLAAVGGATLETVRAACQAGADLILLLEAKPPSQSLHRQWLGLVETICNVTRFHEALPVLLISAGETNVAEIVAHGAVPCLPATGLGQANLPAGPYSLALPTQGDLSGVTIEQAKNHNCALLTTNGDLPYTLEAKALRSVVADLRQAVG